MEEEARKERNRTRLKECHPSFGDRLAAVLKELETKGYRPRIQDAFRTPQAQLAAFQRGNSKLKFGYHNVCSEGGKAECLAADVLDDEAPLRPGIEYLLELARAAEANGLKTGIRWGMPKKLQMAVDRAIKDRAEKITKVGWDPCHVECCGITLAQVKNGKRPG